MNLYIAFELSKKNWKLAFSTGESIRKRTITAGDREAFRAELEKTRTLWKLPADIPVHSVYEAGRDGFWIHRWLESLGIDNLVVDPASIEVNRRKRHLKTDSIDVDKLLRQLMRYHAGERKLWSVVRVPTPEAEDERRREREIKALKKERTMLNNRIKAHLFAQCCKPKTLRHLPQQIEQMRQWNAEALPPQLKEEILRTWERLQLIEEQIRHLEKAREQALAQPVTEAQKMAARLASLRGVGPIGAMLLCVEFFAWRCFRNVREVGACAGLTGTAYDSGESRREQGISKAGNRRVRAVVIELAWSWLRYQPDSALSRWFRERFGVGKRNRRIGIVAMGRKLLVALWKYLEKGELPEGARLKTTEDAATA
jgi:transposase